MGSGGTTRSADEGEGSDFLGPERLPFESQVKIEERRKALFEDAEPRMERMGGGLDLRAGPWRRLLTILEIAFVIIILVVVFLTLSG